MDKSNKTMLVVTALISILFGALSGSVASYALMSSATGNTPAGDTIINFENGSYKEVWEKAAPAVVSVVAMKDISQVYNQFSFFGSPPRQQQKPGDDGDAELTEVSSGTGFILTDDGLVVTNKHVVSDTEAEYVVILDDGTQLDAEVLDKDTLNDIALLQITGDDERIGDLPSLDFADSDAIAVGDPVVAIGNALGEYSNTTTVGIISATGREIIASSGYGSSENLVNLIQTDAAINPGNSGGPLLNLSGDVIGMNTAIDTTASGIGFAIPANDISSVVKSYQEFGHIVRPFVGVRYIPVTPQVVKHFALEVETGVLVMGDSRAQLPGVVPGSPADKAGVKDGDVILAVDDKELDDTYTLSNAIANYMVGDTVTLKINRDGEDLALEVKLEESTEE
jgi:serine protease Do